MDKELPVAPSAIGNYVTYKKIRNYVNTSGHVPITEQKKYIGKVPTEISIDEAYKILGIKKGCPKEDVVKAANGLQKKIHPDLNPNSNTERLSQIVNEAKAVSYTHLTLPTILLV